MNNNKQFYLFILFTLVSTSFLQAEDNPTKINLKQKRVIQLKFDDTRVLGNAENPELTRIMQIDRNNFKKLIKVREDFIPEVESSGYIFKDK